MFLLCIGRKDTNTGLLYLLIQDTVLKMYTKYNIHFSYLRYVFRYSYFRYDPAQYTYVQCCFRIRRPITQGTFYLLSQTFPPSPTESSQSLCRFFSLTQINQLQCSYFIKCLTLKRKKISHRQLGPLRGSSSPFQHFEPARVKPN